MKPVCFLFSLFASLLICAPQHVRAQSAPKSIEFSFAINQDESSLVPQVERKTLKLSAEEFAILGKTSESDYFIAKYDDRLKQQWSVPVNLGLDESLESFQTNPQYLYILTRKVDRSEGSQKIFAYYFDKATGQKAGQKLLFEAPSKGRKVGCVVSDNGTKVLMYQHLLDGNRAIKSMRGAVADQQFKIIKEQLYEFPELDLSFDPIPRIDNEGNQYITFITDDYRKLRVRKYTPRTEVYAELFTAMGGVFEGIDIYIFDHILKLDPKGNPIFAAMTVEDETLRYYSLKVAKFDFDNYVIRMPEEFKFTPEYLAALAQFKRDTSLDAERMVDTYLCDMVLTPEDDILLVAEKRYTRDEYHGGHEAKEMLLFRYNEFLGPEWQSAIWKEQFAPHHQFYSSLGFSTAHFSDSYQIVTYEQIKGRNDLYLRTINRANGTARAPRALNVANSLKQGDTHYLRDFTLWLDKNTLITVTKSKNGVQLNRSRVSDEKSQKPTLILHEKPAETDVIENPVAN